MSTPLIEKIGKLAGPLRSKTFMAAANWIVRNRPRTLAETGCFRGDVCDGNSTLILATIARAIGAKFFCIDNNPGHLALAKAHVKNNGMIRFVNFVESDSVVGLLAVPSQIGFAYLDSFDHDPANPLPCQQHQLCEAKAVLSHAWRRCAILMDDNVVETGGKTKLSSAHLESLGWKKLADGYQLLYSKP